MNTVVFGLLGTTLDRGEGSMRWQNWRPTVSLFQHEELLIQRLELLCDPKFDAVTARVVADIADVSPETTVRTHELTFRDAWDFEEVYGKLHDFARAYPFAPDREQYLCHITTGTHVAQICMFLLTESRHIPGRLIQTGPPRHRERGDPPRYSIIDLDRSKYDRIAARFAREQREAAAFLKAGIETRSAAFNRMIDEIEHVAIHSRAPILLTGPTGAGKSSLARRIHELRRARHEIAGKFVEVNCATIRGDGAMSALFGHKRGAFTGATSDRPGLLREAHGGTLFLDEIGELRPDEQAMLLRAIEERRFLPLGSDREAESDFLLICGTNRDLAAAIRAGTFRDDLLARINMWTFELPGLAARREDIEPNIRYELEQLEARAGRAFRFNTEALERFMAFATSDEAAWKGNFRDLNAAVARMATMSPTGRINEDAVTGEIARLRRMWTAGACAEGEAGSESPSKSLDRLRGLLGAEFDAVDEFDRVQLAHVVDVCRQSASLSAAGRRLFSASREKKRAVNDADRLRKYLARFGLQWSSLVR